MPQFITYNNKIFLFIRHCLFLLTTCCFLLLLTEYSAYAEYRAYQYMVRPNPLLKFEKKYYLVRSTLDPVSYVAYHGGYNSLQVDLLNTWMCMGHTSPVGKGNGIGGELCPPPTITPATINPPITLKE